MLRVPEPTPDDTEPSDEDPELVVEVFLKHPDNQVTPTLTPHGAAK